MRHLIVLLALTACSRTQTPAPGNPSTDGTGLDPITDAPPEEEEALRPPVQRGDRPNADQTPAFEEQNRAGQPADRTGFTTETLVSGLAEVWGFEVMPDGRLLIGEQPGRIRILATDGTLGEPLTVELPDEFPAVDYDDQGGLLDVALAPDFATSSRIFWSYAEREDNLTRTAVATGVIGEDETTLETVEVIFRQQPGWRSTKHYGSRLVFAPDGNLFVTLGERSNADARELAQDPSNTIGAIVRIRPDGTIPGDNPFVGDADKDDAIWSYGHRNLQSATLDLQGRLWTVEHGPQGGDELNRPEAGKNYGWPTITYGENYGGAPIGDGITAQEGLEQPVYYWDPVIAPSGMAVYDGELFEGFQGDLLVGGLRAGAVVRLTLRNDRVYSEEWLDVGARVRDVKVAADGAILASIDSARNGRILRLVPSDD